ncbi:MAG: hypothetical protein QNJ35_15440 [Paracoccaceae bacterium]|nr:hypothetical protein [Paracoccaceae bacterium]
MSEPETTARGGENAPRPQTAADEVKTALAGLVGDITETLANQEERLNMLSAKSTIQTARRPALQTAATDGERRVM